MPPSACSPAAGWLQLVNTSVLVPSSAGAAVTGANVDVTQCCTPLHTQATCSPACCSRPSRSSGRAPSSTMGARTTRCRCRRCSLGRSHGNAALHCLASHNPLASYTLLPHTPLVEYTPHLSNTPHCWHSLPRTPPYQVQPQHMVATAPPTAEVLASVALGPSSWFETAITRHLTRGYGRSPLGSLGFP